MRSAKTEPKMAYKGSGRSSSGGQKFLLFLLVLAAGFNTYQTIRLNAEISDLRARLHPGDDSAANSSKAPAGGGASSLFDQARSEIGQAEAKLHLKDYDKARVNLAQGVVSLERANAQTRAEGEKLLAELKNATQSLQDKPIGGANQPAKSAHSKSSDDDQKQATDTQ